MTRIQPSPVAGKWYQDSTNMLRYDMSRLIENMSVVRKRTVCAAVVPHAGYRFSGRVAAGVYMRIDPRRYRRILVMGPSHYLPMPDRISIGDFTHYSTPLGLVPVDTEWVARARKLSFVVNEPAAHAEEHSDQIQLPLIQSFVSAKIPVVCLVCGQFARDRVVEAGHALRELLDDETLVVASSDFTHFGARFGYEPGQTPSQGASGTVEASAFELFASKDVDGFLRYIHETGTSLCGRDPLALLVTMMPSDSKVTRTGVDPSSQNRAAGQSVSYVGALVEGAWKVPVRETKPQPARGPIDEADGRFLVSLARAVLRRAFKTKCFRPIWGIVPPGVTEGMKGIRGGFVTLRKDGVLRGCIGEVIPRREVWKVVTEHALNAAFQDARFPPLEELELGTVAIEVSVLSPPEPVASWRDIRLGCHGVILRKRSRSAVFLPQVAVEQGWSLEETLDNLALKAGLPSDGWRTETDFLVFKAQVFHE